MFFYDTLQKGSNVFRHANNVADNWFYKIYLIHTDLYTFLFILHIEDYVLELISQLNFLLKRVTDCNQNRISKIRFMKIEFSSDLHFFLGIVNMSICIRIYMKTFYVNKYINIILHLYLQ